MSYQSKVPVTMPAVQVSGGTSAQGPAAVGARIHAASAVRSLFDKAFAALALLFFAPLLVTISLVLKLREGGAIFYAHERVGQGGRRFRCLKFRTMVPDADARLAKLLAQDPVARAEWEVSRKLTNDPRVSCVGRFLRRTSLDELPQFFNVLRGDMAIVGPRPIVTEELSLYREHMAGYMSVRPGITGLWQVSGRSDTTFQERVAFDALYLSKRSFAYDLQIIGKTIIVLFTQKGAR